MWNFCGIKGGWILFVKVKVGFDGLLKGARWCLAGLHVNARENSRGAIVEVRWIKGGWMLFDRLKVGGWGSLSVPAAPLWLIYGPWFWFLILCLGGWMPKSEVSLVGK